MTLVIRHAWLQKHPSPAASRGEFHWFPSDGDRELRASVVERSRGVDAPAVLWQLAPGRVSWAQVFAATAPTDGRRYAGLVLTTAEDVRATPAELLEALALPAAAPWSEAMAAGPAAVIEAAPGGGASVDRRRERARRWSAREAVAVAIDDDDLASEVASEVAMSTEGCADVAAAPRRESGAMPLLPLEIAAIARALLAGRDAVLANASGAELPRCIASVERWMPGSVGARPRAGVWRTGAALPERGARGDRVAELVAAAWCDPASRAAQAWTLLCELAAAKERTVDEIAAELGAAAQPAAVLTDAERAAAGEARDFVATLHAWGRGRLDGVGSASSLPTRLADAVALRVLACLIAGGDPRAPIAEARWHALLPAARRSVLLDAVVRRAGSLRALVEVSHA